MISSKISVTKSKRRYDGVVLVESTTTNNYGAVFPRFRIQGEQTFMGYKSAMDMVERGARIIQAKKRHNEATKGYTKNDQR